jgi:hypothetical protein
MPFAPGLINPVKAKYYRVTPSPLLVHSPFEGGNYRRQNI